MSDIVCMTSVSLLLSIVLFVTHYSNSGGACQNLDDQDVGWTEGTHRRATSSEEPGWHRWLVMVLRARQALREWENGGPCRKKSRIATSTNPGSSPYGYHPSMVRRAGTGTGDGKWPRCQEAKYEPRDQWDSLVEMLCDVPYESSLLCSRTSSIFDFVSWWTNSYYSSHSMGKHSLIIVLASIGPLCTRSFGLSS